jgi:hypothetical protein
MSPPTVLERRVGEADKITAAKINCMPRHLALAEALRACIVT